MNKDFATYSPVDFLKDELFLRWQLFHSEEDDLFWQSCMQDSPEKQIVIQEAIRLFSFFKMNEEHFSFEEKNVILNNIYKKANQRKKKQYLYYLSAAACIALLVVFTVFKTGLWGDYGKEMTAQAKFPGNSREIQLVLSNEKVLNFKHDANITFNDKGEVLVNSENSQPTSMKVNQGKAQWNKLIVPKGKRSFLTLADGSKVWVNAGTTLKFPTSFSSQKRELFVDGEIYIQVTRNEQVPFLVNTKRFTVSVLGTRFNVSAYAGDSLQSVVLEEGSVEVIPASRSLKKIKLKPDQMLQVDRNSYNVQAVDVYDYICWKDELVQFKSEPLPAVLSRLGKYYGVPITYDSSVRNLKCTGKLVLFDDVEDVLRVIAKSVPIIVEKRGDQIYIGKVRS